MIERLHGTVCILDDKHITVMVNGIGFGMSVADPQRFYGATKAPATIYTYVHWSADKGGSIFGFNDEISRQLFCLLIGCQKIGPSIALALLRQREVGDLVQDILTGNIAGLSSCQGIGTKKAELIIYELKDKVASLAHRPELANSAAQQLRHMQEALLSLSYSAQEATKAVTHVAKLYAGQEVPEVNVLLRQALAFLSSSSAER